MVKISSKVSAFMNGSLSQAAMNPATSYLYPQVREAISIDFLETIDKYPLLRWAKERKVFCILDSNRKRGSSPDPYSGYDYILAADAVKELKIDPAGGKYPFDQLRVFHDSVEDWVFGYFTYDLKNETENLTSENSDHLNFPAMHFFQPRLIFKCGPEELIVEYLQEYDDLDTVVETIENIFNNFSTQKPILKRKDPVQIKERISKTEYIKTVDRIKKNILRGDIYEMNYCVEFYSENANLNTESVYRELNKISPMPFSCYYKADQNHLVCASPERFLAKRGNKIISQPIKGTARRGKTKGEDLLIKFQLEKDQKEQSENVMIVDLVRNDLSRTAIPGSVKVEELCGVYTFRQLHQLISTVVSEVKDETDWTDVIKMAFPMGSMTGAPKVRAMELIEEYEKTKRGLYSGAVGYVTPTGDFDFNVVIRSILYNEKNNYLSFMVGSAITAKSEAETEYEECMLKARAMIKAIGKSS